MKESKWIDFEKQEKKEHFKTDIWIIFTKDGRTNLGFIKWYGRWRGYAFFPQSDTIYEEDCLRDIADFIETETKEYRQEAKNKKEGKNGY